MDRKSNNFNLLRLFFAWAVIVSHSFELIDGNRFREPLTTLFGTLSLGDLAVDAFFLISGCMITQSWFSDPDARRYLMRRFVRIVPGFMVSLAAAIIAYCLLISPALLHDIQWPAFLGRLLVLQVKLPIVFEGSFHPSLNGSLWTIHYELLCYFGLLLLGVTGLLKRSFIVVIWAFLVGGYSLYLLWSEPSRFSWITWLEKKETLMLCFRMSGCYVTGVLWFYFQDQLRRLPVFGVFLCLLGFLLCLSFRSLSALSVCVFLVPLLSYAAYTLPTLPGFWIRHDLSYGVYLYAWPVQKLLLALVPMARNAWVLIALTTIIVMILATLSWILVERVALKYKPRKPRQPPTPVGAFA